MHAWRRFLLPAQTNACVLAAHTAASAALKCVGASVLFAVVLFVQHGYIIVQQVGPGKCNACFFRVHVYGGAYLPALQIPEAGYVPTNRRQDLPQAVLQELVEAALASEVEPWCWLLGGSSGPDSWLVLRTSSVTGQCTGGCTVLHLQSKLTQRDATFSMEKVRAEVLKVQPTQRSYDAAEVLAIFTDHRPPKRQGRRSSNTDDSDSGSAGGSSPSSSPTAWQQIVGGRAVYLHDLEIWVTVVFQDQQWQVRGGAAL